MGLSLPKSNLIFWKKCLDKWVHFTGKHWGELCEGMQMHYRYYREVLNDDTLMEHFKNNQIQYMRAYTEEFMLEKQNVIKNQLREWHGDEKYERFLKEI